MVSVKVVDATTNVPLSGAYVTFRDDHHLQYFGQGQTDQMGLFEVGFFRNGTVNI